MGSLLDPDDPSRGLFDSDADQEFRQELFDQIVIVLSKQSFKLQLPCFEKSTLS
jgi:hypothetical protein